jgi:hypothetical protein
LEKAPSAFFQHSPGIFHLLLLKAGASHLTNKKPSQLFSSAAALKKVIAN